MNEKNMQINYSNSYLGFNAFKNSLIFRMGKNHVTFELFKLFTSIEPYLTIQKEIFLPVRPLQPRLVISRQRKSHRVT